MSLTQSRYKLLSGDDSLDCLSAGDFATVRDIVEQRLFIALCLTTAPTTTNDDDETVDDILWLQLLADALSVYVSVKHDDGIQSENMRNYSYQLRDYANSWLALSMKSGDLINNFNACESGVVFQTNIADVIYGINSPCEDDDDDEYI